MQRWTPPPSLPPGTALPITLPPGDKTLQLDLAPGVAAFAGWHDAVPVAVWGGRAAVSRTHGRAWTELLLVNLGSVAAPARVASQPARLPSPCARAWC